MSDDIVATLRLWAKNANEQGVTNAVDGLQAAADEIERLCAELVSTTNKLTAERDEARWRLCKVVGDNRGVWGCEIAKQNGWDYLATEAREKGGF